MACSGCWNRHDGDRCPHGTFYDETSDWVRQAIAEIRAEYDRDCEE